MENTSTPARRQVKMFMMEVMIASLNYIKLKVSVVKHVMHGIFSKKNVIGGHVVRRSEAKVCIPPSI